MHLPGRQPAPATRSSTCSDKCIATSSPSHTRSAKNNNNNNIQISLTQLLINLSCSFTDFALISPETENIVKIFIFESVVSEGMVAMARSLIFLVAVVAAMWVMGVTDAATANCDSSASALVPCYSYVTGPDAKPPTDCCGGLSSLNTNSPVCLCQLITQLNGSAASQPSLNITKAFNLPKDCAITLKTSDCPALANLPVPTTTSPSTSSPGPSAAGPAGSPVPGNDVPRLLPTTWMVVGLTIVHALW